MEVKIVKTIRGADILLVNNYSFYKERMTKCGGRWWRCSEKKKCKSKVLTTGPQYSVTKYHGFHTHEANLKKLRENIMYNFYKRQQVEKYNSKRLPEIIVPTYVYWVLQINDVKTSKDNTLRGGDLYSKTSSPINHSVPYFPTVSDPSYITHPRLSTLQHHLHVSTNNSTPSMEIPRSHNWSNLVIPYHQQTNYSTPSSPSEGLDRNKSMENYSCTSTGNGTKDSKKKKKNPYSIEELLKKPDKKVRPVHYGCTRFQQPFGGLVTNEEFYREASSHSSTTSDSDQEKDIKIDVE